MAEPTDPIARRGPFLLDETDDAFGIWRQGSPDPIETFPMTDEGFDEAEARLVALLRESRWQRWNLPRILWIILIASGALWVTAGTFTSFFLFDPYEGLLGQLGWGAEALGYRALTASFLALVGWSAYQRRGELRLPRADEAPGERPSDPATRRLRLWIAVGLSTWVVAGILERVLRPEASLPIPIPVDPGPGLPGWYVTVVAIDVIAFRLWVAGLVILGLRSLLGKREAATGDEGSGTI